MSTTTRRPSARAEKAQASRRTMRAAALRLFESHGYAATSMQAIAAESGFAVQTLYFTFGTKRALLSEILDIAVAGDEEPVATLDRPAVHDLLTEPDPAQQLHRQAELTQQILHRLAPVLDVVRGAAGADPEIAELWQTNISQRATVLQKLATSLAAKGKLRHDIATTVDIALALQSPEVYQLLVKERGWAPAKYVSWLAEGLRSQLLE